MSTEPDRHSAAILCLFLLGSLPAHAAENELSLDMEASPTGTQVGGVAEARALWLAPGGEPSGRAQQLGLRMTLEHKLSDEHTVVVHAEGQWMHASDAGTLQRLRERSAPPTDRATRLAWEREGPRQQRSAALDWLYVHGAWAHGRYSVGRQPINPSLGRLWSPVDLYAPYQPGDLERLYKPGVDAAQWQWFLGEGVQSTTIASAARSTEAGRPLRWQWQQRLDMEVPWGKAFAMAGTRHQQKLLGGGVQFNGLLGNDVYAEVLVHRGPQADTAPGTRGNGVRTLLGATRKVGENTQGTLEWMHQSRGIADTRRYTDYTQRAMALDLPFLGTGRHYLGVSVSARPDPLWGLDALVLGNLSDHSASLTLAVEHTPQPNLKLRVTLGVPVAGRVASEYRRQGRALQLGAQWFF